MAYEQHNDRPPPKMVAEDALVTVKWFSADKGYGFVNVDGGGDAFLPARNIPPGETMEPGVRLRVDIGEGNKGPFVMVVQEVLDERADVPVRPVRSPSPREPAVERRSFRSASFGVPAAHGLTTHTTGVVRFFSNAKGFGFVAAHDGLKDVYVRSATLAAAGLTTLLPDQQVRMSVVDTPRGREAVELGLL
jgi:CspA family cold shock protein